MTLPYSSLSCGMSYTLGVSAYDSLGHSSTITKTSATTAACVDATAPLMPTPPRHEQRPTEVGDAVLEPVRRTASASPGIGSARQRCHRRIDAPRRVVCLHGPVVQQRLFTRRRGLRRRLASPRWSRQSLNSTQAVHQRRLTALGAHRARDQQRRADFDDAVVERLDFWRRPCRLPAERELDSQVGTTGNTFTPSSASPAERPTTSE